MTEQKMWAVVDGHGKFELHDVFENKEDADRQCAWYNTIESTAANTVKPCRVILED